MNEFEMKSNNYKQQNEEKLFLVRKFRNLNQIENQGIICVEMKKLSSQNNQFEIRQFRLKLFILIMTKKKKLWRKKNQQYKNTNFFY